MTLLKWTGTSHHMIQKVTAWLPPRTVCSTVVAPHSRSTPGTFWTRKYLKGRVWRSGANKTTLSNKTVANSFYNDHLLYCLISLPGLLRVTLAHGMQWRRHSRHWRSGPRHPPLYRVCTEEHHCKSTYTHSHVYFHIQTELNNSKSGNSPNLVYKYSTELAIRSHQYGLHCQVYFNSGSPSAVHPSYLLAKIVLKEV